MSRKKYWKCSNCGTILFKKETTQQMALMAGVNVSGGETCSQCYKRHDAADVYSGKYEFQCDDALIDQMISDPANTQGDRETKTWTYKGKIVK